MRQKKIMRKMAYGGAIISLALFMSGVFLIKKAQADALNNKSDTMTRLEDATASNHTIKFTMSATGSGVAEGETITVTFPAGFDTSTITEDDVDITDDTVDLTTAATCAGSEKASVAMSSDVLTITICAGDGGAIAASSVVEIQIGTNADASGTGSHQIVNDAVGSASIAIAGSNNDSGNLLVQIIDDDSVNITASVAETLSFTISDTEISFGALAAGTGRWATGTTGGNASDPGLPTAAHTLAIGTNATGGWAITYNGATLADAALDTITDIAPTVSDSDGTPGSEQFGICASSDDDMGNIASGYERTTDANWDFVPSTTTTLASETEPTATETISVSYLANIATLTEAGSYSTDITYVATATY